MVLLLDNALVLLSGVNKSLLNECRPQIRLFLNINEISHLRVPVGYLVQHVIGTVDESTFQIVINLSVLFLAGLFLLLAFVLSDDFGPFCASLVPHVLRD